MTRTFVALLFGILLVSSIQLPDNPQTVVRCRRRRLFGCLSW